MSLADWLWTATLAVAVPVAWFCGWWMAKQALTSQPRRDWESMQRHASLRHWPPNSDTADGRAGLDALGDLRQERDEVTS